MTTTTDIPNIPNEKKPAPKSIFLTTHPSKTDSSKPLPIDWDAAEPKLRGPIVATLQNPGGKNAVGPHSGADSLYRAHAIAAGQLKAEHKPDLTNTSPAERIGPFQIGRAHV